MYNLPMKRKKKLDIDQVIREFRELEESKSHHSGTFKIDEPFEKALKTILKSKSKSSMKAKGAKNG